MPNTRRARDATWRKAHDLDGDEIAGALAFVGPVIVETIVG
jgi:hypothetical protein